jgi:hypothetical protein
MKRILVATAFIGSLAYAVAAKADCSTPEVVKATQVRQLQTQLMVAALKCSHMPQHAASYNSFVRAFGPQISDSARVLMAHFKRNSKSPQQSFDRFITQLANNASTVSIDTPDFCESIATTFSEVQGLRGIELASFAATTINGHTAAPAACK